MNKTNESRMKSAFPRERVPKELEEKTLARERAVVMGRRAEELLRGKAPADASPDTLMARAMVGRMALATELPKGASPEKMADALQKTEGYKAYRTKGMDAQMDGLHSGAFLKALAPKTAGAHKDAAPRKTEPSTEKGMTR